MAIQNVWSVAGAFSQYAQVHCRMLREVSSEREVFADFIKAGSLRFPPMAAAHGRWQDLLPL